MLTLLQNRLSGYPKIKKESSSYAVKVVQPTLKMLTDQNSEAIWVSWFGQFVDLHLDSVYMIVFTLMLGCCLMLTNSYSAKVLFSLYNVFLQLMVSSVYSYFGRTMTKCKLQHIIR